MAAEGEGSGESLDPLVREALERAERTLAADSARFQVWHDMDASLPQRKPRRRGGLLRPLVKLAGAAGRRAWEHAGRRWTSFRFEGVIEPRRRRHMATSPWGAEISMEGERWTGRVGEPLATLEPVRGDGFPVDVWFLLDVLGGLHAATVEGEETVRGTSCRRIAARVDIARASAAAPEGVRPPSVDRFEELLALPLTVWIDGTHVRRIRFKEDIRTLRLDLWDFGVATDRLDWSRLPKPEPSDAAEKAGDAAAWSHGRKLLRRVRPTRR